VQAGAPQSNPLTTQHFPLFSRQTDVEVKTRDEFGLVAQAINGMAAGLGERDHVKSAFARYVSKRVMESVLKSDGSAIQLSGDRRRISVLFSDIRGFSTISENLPPEKVVKLLNDYFEFYSGTRARMISSSEMD
jgi:adenylate cyclase